MSRSPVKVSIVADTKRFRKQLKRVQRKLWWFSIDWWNVGGWVVLGSMTCVALYSIGAVLWTLRVVVWT